MALRFDDPDVLAAFLSMEERDKVHYIYCHHCGKTHKFVLAPVIDDPYNISSFAYSECAKEVLASLARDYLGWRYSSYLPLTSFRISANAILDMCPAVVVDDELRLEVTSILKRLSKYHVDQRMAKADLSGVVVFGPEDLQRLGNHASYLGAVPAAMMLRPYTAWMLPYNHLASIVSNLMSPAVSMQMIASFDKLVKSVVSTLQDYSFQHLLTRQNKYADFTGYGYWTVKNSLLELVDCLPFGMDVSMWQLDPVSANRISRTPWCTVTLSTGTHVSDTIGVSLFDGLVEIACLVLMPLQPGAQNEVRRAILDLYLDTVIYLKDSLV